MKKDYGPLFLAGVLCALMLAECYWIMQWLSRIIMRAEHEALMMVCIFLCCTTLLSCLSVVYCCTMLVQEVKSIPVAKVIPEDIPEIVPTDDIVSEAEVVTEPVYDKFIKVRKELYKLEQQDEHNYEEFDKISDLEELADELYGQLTADEQYKADLASGEFWKYN